MFGVLQNPRDMGSNVSEEIDLPVRARQGGKESKLPFSMSFIQAVTWVTQVVMCTGDAGKATCSGGV